MGSERLLMLVVMTELSNPENRAVRAQNPLRVGTPMVVAVPLNLDAPSLCPTSYNRSALAPARALRK